MFSATRRLILTLKRQTARPLARRLASTNAKTLPPRRTGTPAVAAGAVSLAGAGLVWKSRTGDDIPSLDAPPAPYTSFLPPELSSDDVTSILSKNAFSVAPRNIAGLTRYDGAQVASNSPCEDHLVHGAIASPRGNGSQWAVWAVLDGHAGAETADVLSRALVPFVQHRLKETFQNDKTDTAAVEKSIAQSFKVQTMLPAFAGSCALLALYDADTGRLHVACTGDSRAVIGRQASGGAWETLPPTIDQTGYNADEVARLQKEHPGEETMTDIKRRFYSPPPLTPRYDVRTPPYLTAEPVVTTVRVEPGQPCVLILATDGLWDHMKSSQAVDLVGNWLEPSSVEVDADTEEDVPDGPFDFGHFWKGVSYKFQPERTVVKDENAAVHLIRNSLVATTERCWRDGSRLVCRTRGGCGMT
ncbi:hypothetical protein SEUCBS140593_010304 [Sporothrix eucalyptigena]|uniref:PPM-type phosphatase domain-containing protein n=1 Tax=Sporothrix eucalyptigena TaxID=1812306 RepID=A0ABP0D0Y9_9PEZI